MESILRKRLLDYYREDIQDYTELKRLINSFFENAPNQLDNLIMNDFTQKRIGIFTSLKKRNSERVQTFKGISHVNSTQDVNVWIMKNLMVVDHLVEFNALVDQLKQLMEEIHKLDSHLQEKLSTELEATKLEISRIRQTKKAFNAYQSNHNQEARYIDKNK